MKISNVINKKTIISALFFSCTGTLLWMLSYAWGTEAVVFLIIMTVITFLFHFLVTILSDHLPKAISIIAKVIVIFFTIIELSYVLFTVLASYAIFHPVKSELTEKMLMNDELYGKQIEHIEFEGSVGKISGWMIKSEHENKPLVLYFGGNAEVSSNKIFSMISEGSYYSVFEDCNFVMLDMPGYGNTDSFPNEKNLKSFGLDYYDYITNNYSFSKIIIMGYSIGTGTAQYVASERYSDGAVFIAPYADGIDLNNSRLNIFYGPLRELVAFKMEAIHFAEKVEIRPLIIASKTDEIIPYQSSERFKTAYKDGCNFITLDNASHGSFFNNDEVNKQIKNYIEGVTDK